MDVGRGHDAADETKEGDGDAEEGSDPSSGLPCAAEDVEVGKESADESE